MRTFRHVYAILYKEVVLEIRRKHAFFGILLFSMTLVFLIYKSFNQLKGLEWDVLMWTAVLFSGINAIAKSFTQEANASQMYYYTLFNAQEVIIGKMIYNFLFLVLLTGLTYLGFSFFLGNAIRDFPLFIGGALLGVYGLSAIFTFIASVSAQGEGNNGVLMSVMAIPLTIPILLLLIKITAVAMGLLVDTAVGEDLTMLAAIDLLLSGLILILFEFIWKD
ncbi:MAG: heme exporter protein CcmB [Saprospiraceae bacterium]|nr:heme exporter protein CcmB [Saprospiraceae bacterium]